MENIVCSKDQPCCEKCACTTEQTECDCTCCKEKLEAAAEIKLAQMHAAAQKNPEFRFGV